MQTKWKKWIKRGEIIPSMAPLPAIFFKVDYLSTIYCENPWTYQSVSHFFITCPYIRQKMLLYKKNPVKHISGILESKWFEIRIDNNYPVFFSCRRMLAWHWKENHYNHIYIKKKRCGGIWNTHFYLN